MTLPTATPPSVPDDAVYTANYCEENIYLLARDWQSDSLRDLWDLHVVFMSNATKSVALWNQKLNDSVVVWDYHVVLVLRTRAKFANAGRTDVHTVDTRRCSDDGCDDGQDRRVAAWVYDFDSRLGMPCSVQEYTAQTFPQHVDIPAPYRSLFRVVPAEDYLDTFASDRSHMLAGDGSHYLSPTPNYPPLCGAAARARGVANNLMASFVDMGETMGEVKGLDDFVQWSLN